MKFAPQATEGDAACNRQALREQIGIGDRGTWMRQVAGDLCTRPQTDPNNTPLSSSSECSRTSRSPQRWARNQLCTATTWLLHEPIYAFKHLCSVIRCDQLYDSQGCFVTIRLSGHIHNDDNLALSEIARQLDEQMATQSQQVIADGRTGYRDEHAGRKRG